MNFPTEEDSYFELLKDQLFKEITKMTGVENKWMGKKVLGKQGSIIIISITKNGNKIPKGLQEARVAKLLI